MDNNQRKIHMDASYIGNGSDRTTVYEGHYKLDIAVKRIPREKVQKPIENLRADGDYEHENIAPTYGFEEEGDYILQAMEKFYNNLSDLISQKNILVMRVGQSTHDTPAFAELIRQVCTGLEFLHSKGALVKNLKHSSIFCKNGIIKIAPVSVKSDPDPHWKAPEEVGGHDQQSTASDIFRLGLIMMRCLCLGNMPFTLQEYQQALNNGAYETFISQKILGCRATPEATHLLTNLLSEDPSSRYSAGEILLHPLLLTDHEKVAFLRDVSNLAEFDGAIQDCINEVQAEILGGRRWDQMVQELYKDMSKQRSYRVYSLKDLICMIRNANGHEFTLNQNTRTILERQGGLYGYISKQFPKLVMVLYQKIIDRGCSGHPDIQKYFVSAHIFTKVPLKCP